MLLPLVLSTWVLPSVSSTGTLQCFECANSTQATCKPNLVTCTKEDDACVTYFEKVTIGVKDTTLFLRMCGKCDMFMNSIVRFQKGIVKSNSTCCRSSSCSPPEPTIAPDRPAPEKTKDKNNGIICKSCYTSAKSCDCNTFVNCTGAETRCTLRNMIVTGSYIHFMAIRGCTTNSTCQDLNPKNYKMKSYSVVSEIVCSNNSDFLPRSPLALVLSAIFLLGFRPVMC